MKNFFIALLAVVVIGLLAIFIAPAGLILRPYFNTIDYMEHKIDEKTSYKLKKQVEDTCRAMIASYEADKLTYDLYKDSDIAEEASWAKQAKMRANKTASTYNNYILENSFVWGDNVPSDIDKELDYL